MKLESIVIVALDLAEKIVNLGGPYALILILALLAVLPVGWGWLMRQGRRP